MTYDIILAGVGGQGVLSLAAIVARAAMIDGLLVRQSEVHGMAQRGGAVLAHLRISDRPIAGDLVPSGGADMILSMEPLESLRYLSYLKPEGIVVTAAEPFVNIPDYPELETVLAAVRSLPRSALVAAADIAKEAGSPRAVNMALAGAASLLLPIKLASLERGIEELFGAKDPKAAQVNRLAFELARAAVAGSEGRGAMNYWDEGIETLPRRDLEALQLERLRAAVARALLTPFYKPLLAKAGVTGPESIRALADITRLPFTSKDDLRKAYPFGLLAGPRSDLVRLHASSGTTGTPTVIYQTKADLDRWTDYLARSVTAPGARSDDVFQNMITYGLFTGGLGMHYGAERAGMLVIPAGPGNVGRQLKLMKDFGTTTVHATPSFMLHLQSKMAEEGVSRSELKLKRAYCGAEPYSEDTRRKIESMLEIDVYNSYGLSEMNGPGLAFECVHKSGMHVWEDGFLLEVIDPDTGLALPDGERGELVFTILCRDAMPILRYRTHDLSSVILGDCPCGRTHRRIERITGRTDDMLIVNGVNLFPSQVEEVLMRMSEVGTNWLIVVEKEGQLDKLTVKTEVQPSMFADDSRPLNALRERVKERLHAALAVGVRVELHEPGSLPISEGKAKRVLDTRPKF